MQKIEKSLALFDFDGTITTRDSFPLFLKFALSPLRFYFSLPLISPFVFGYFTGLINGEKLKIRLLDFYFRGSTETELNEIGHKFVDFLKTRNYIKSQMIDTINQYRSQGFEICIVSASPCIYLKAFASSIQANLICTELHFESGKYSGKFRTLNCNGPEKLVRIKASYDLNSYSKIVAYGNSEGDMEMLELAHEKIMVK